jgi:ubiquinone/menaquinone biosynthesis C-methylase UbiE
MAEATEVSEMTPDGKAHTGVDREFVAWNEAMAERYDIERYYERSHTIVKWLERQRLASILQLAAAAPGDRILEVGCGAGHVLEQFADNPRTGIDLSAGMLGRIRRRLGPAVDLARGSADGLPFANGAFDIVLCTEVLEHVPDPAAVIAELTRVAGPEGRVVVSIPNEVNIDRAKRTLRSIPVIRSLLRTLAAENNEWHLHEFDLAMLRRIVSGHARIDTLCAIPYRALPLRYVALLRSTGQGRKG